MRLLLALVPLLTWCNAISARDLQPPVPVPAKEAIFTALVEHDVVALSHHDDQSIDFLTELCRDPRLRDLVDYIVVEFGTAAQQGTIDRYIAGEAVDPHELARVWEDTTDPSYTWDVPAVQQLFRAIREANRVSGDRKLKVILGEPPIDWSDIHIESDLHDQLRKVGNRDEHVAQLIKTRVFDERRKAIVAYGALHLQRKNIFANYERGWPEADNWVMRLSDQQRKKVYTIWRVLAGRSDVDVSRWNAPTIADLSGTNLGAADFSSYFSYQGPRRKQVAGKPVDIPPSEWRSVSMEEQFDAVIYLGPSRSFEKWQLPKEKCADHTYLRMRLARMQMFAHTRQSAAALQERCRE